MDMNKIISLFFLLLPMTWYCGVKSPLGVQGNLNYQATQITLQLNLSVIVHTFICCMTCELYLGEDYIFSVFSQNINKSVNGVRLRIGI